MTNACLSLSLPDEIYGELGQVAQMRGVGRSAVMRHALRLYLQLQEMEKNGTKLLAVDHRGERELMLVGFVPRTKHMQPRIVEKKGKLNG